MTVPLVKERKVKRKTINGRKLLKKTFSFVFALILALSFGLMPGTVIADTEEIVIDGKISPGEWNGFEWFTDNSTGCCSLSDQTAMKGYLAFDSENLYAAIVFKSEEDYCSLPSLWAMDGFYLRINKPPIGTFDAQGDVIYFRSVWRNSAWIWGYAELKSPLFIWKGTPDCVRKEIPNGVGLAGRSDDSQRIFELKIPLSIIGANSGNIIGLKPEYYCGVNDYGIPPIASYPFTGKWWDVSSGAYDNVAIPSTISIRVR